VKRGRLLAGGSIMTVALLAAALAAAPGAWAKGAHSGPSATPFQDISSAGPLTHVYLGNELSCQVAHSGDADLELYPPDTIPGDCGSFLVVQNTDTLYAPDFEGHGSTATGSLGTYTILTPVSQSGVTGSGTSGDPYKVTTVAAAGATGLTMSTVDSYVVGQESYTTSVTVINGGASSRDLILFRAGDCFLGGSDEGLGQVTGSAIACVQEGTGRIEEWVPISSGSHYYEAFYDDVWGWIGSHQEFPDTCECANNIDNGAGLSWTFTLRAGAQRTFSHITTFSPLGTQPLPTSKTADSALVAPGGQDGYTITITNPNGQDVSVTDITDTLPDGFLYVPGSTTGITTDDPVIVGQDLTWNGPFTDPANGDISLHFLVTASLVPGDYFNEAGGDAEEGFSVVPTGPTAEITVATGADLSIQKTDSPDPVLVGDLLTYTLDVANAGPEDATNVVVTDALPSSEAFESASASQGTCSEAGGTVTCNLGDIAAGGDATVTIVVTPNQEGTVTNTGVVTSDTEDTNQANNTDTITTTVNPVPGGGIQTGAGGTSAPGGTSPWLIALAFSLLFGGVVGVRRILRT